MAGKDTTLVMYPQTHNLIFFSGGVESTALLSQAPKESILVSVSNNIDKISLSPHCQQIANYYNLRLVDFHWAMPKLFDSDVFSHQLTAFVSIAHLLCDRYPQIKEIWVGQNNLEPTPIGRRFYEFIDKNWHSLQPKVSWRFPLKHLTKLEQWRMIPAELQPLVSSCLNNSNCLICYKCKERLKAGINPA